MRTDKQRLVQGLKSFAYTVAALFLTPFLLYQAFKNQGHPFFIPVLVVGLVMAVLAVYLGFRSVGMVIDAVFGKKPSKP